MNLASLPVRYNIQVNKSATRVNLASLPVRYNIQVNKSATRVKKKIQYFLLVDRLLDLYR